MNKAISLCIFIVMSCSSFAQVNADSLWGVWNDNTQPDTSRLEALDKMIWDVYLYSQPDSAFYFAQLEYDFANARDIKIFMGYALNIQGISFRLRGDYPKALEYYHRVLTIREEMGDKKRVAGSLNNIGLIYYNQDQYPKALVYYQRSLKIYEEIGNKMGAADVLNNIGIIYVKHKDKSKALEYFQKSLKIYEESGDKKAIADCLTNIGNSYKDVGDFLKSREYHQKSLAIYEEIGDKKGIADCMINLGMTAKNEGDYPKALEYYQRSLLTYKEIGDKNGIVNCLNDIGSIYGSQGNYQKAIIECQKGLQMANEIATFSNQKAACKCLYDAYKAIGNTNKALEYYEYMQVMNDSLQTEETAKQLERMEFQTQMLADSLKQEEEKLRMKMENNQLLSSESKKRNMATAGGVFFIFLAAGLYSRVRYIRKSKTAIEKERDRSENLLLNILPAEIAEELKEKGRADAHEYDLVSILFTDFKEFTQTAEKLSAKELVEEINICFEAFDNICSMYGIEKIKTIGDAYMAAGGLPVPALNSVKHTVLAALDMLEIISKRKAEMDNRGLPSFEMRVGIHTGPVVAGIVGVKKFQYDLWGDTVNTANRMESSGEAGKVNISQATYALIKEYPEFVFEGRGKIAVKGKGAIEMFFVERKPEKV